MRNSISVSLVIVAIILAVSTTFVGGIAQAHAANGFVAASGGYGLLIALIVGLTGIALKPVNGPSRDEQIEAAFLVAAYESEADAIAAWPIWEGFVLPECLTPESSVRFVSDGVEVCDELSVVRSTTTASVTAKQAKAIQQQRAIKAELARKDLTSAELFELGCALIAAKKGLLA